MVSRRTALKAIGMAGLGALALGHTHRLPSALAAGPEDITFPSRWNGQPLARITQPDQPARRDPDAYSGLATTLTQDSVVRVHRVVQGQRYLPNNDLWLETKYGYLYASFVQPLTYWLTTAPVADLGAGRWAELIVPRSRIYTEPDPSIYGQPIYQTTVFRVVELVTGADGHSWYRIAEFEDTYYIRATHLRLIDNNDLTPLSPDVPPEDKRLEINLRAQTLVAYEGDQPVWEHYVSTGVEGFDTPVGEHAVYLKTVTTRMSANASGDSLVNYYNLPGVPYVCYFTRDGVATHGTYWHNDYGRPRSNGCVNLPPEAARWVWRWTTPHYPVDELYHFSEAGEGTRVVVKAS